MYDGEGFISFKDGSIYKGKVRNGLFHGKGVYIWPNLTKLEMNFN